jgi:CheY-like chemotaxis protein
MPVETSRTRAPQLSGVRVLIVEDDEDCRELFKILLELSGASVATAARAREGLSVFLGTRPHVLVSDLSMPDEDGCWLIRNVHAAAGSNGSRPGAIVVTAHSDDDNRTRCLAAGFDVYLTKPVMVDELCDVVARLACGAAPAGRVSQ